MRNSFRQNLILAYGLSLFLLTITSIASFVSIRNLLYNQGLVNNANQVIIKLENIISVLKDAETGQRGFLLTGNEVFLAPYHGGYEKTLTYISEARQLSAEKADRLDDYDKLSDFTTRRLNMLAEMIGRKKRGEPIQESYLLLGKEYMDSARSMIDRIERREHALLMENTFALNRFANATPPLIIIAAALAILVTVVSFYKVLKDFKKRSELQDSLQQQNDEIRERIDIIENISGKIASGDYSVRVGENEKKSLGVLADSLDSMAESLDVSFTKLANNEWLQKGLAGLNEKIIGEKEIERLTYIVVEYIAGFINAPVAVFYIVKNSDTLRLCSSIGLVNNKEHRDIAFGSGVAGRCAMTGKQVLLSEVSNKELLINFSAGSIKPENIIAVPVFHEGKLRGVIELASLEVLSEIKQHFLSTACFNIGIAIHSAIDHQRLQELLAETQSQSEELQTQHSELENLNAELESQAEILQSSEEELRVQQEELQQANQELEERSRLLEEKNELILERNLDIQRKAEELALSTKYKSEFLANMSHELRTPLNSILLLSRLLSENHDKNLNKDQIEYASVIQNSGKGLLTLIDEILDLSKIESGKMELNYAETDIRELANDLRRLFAQLAREKNIGFTVTLSDGIPPVVETDRMKVEQIMRNLVSNALKFTKSGSVDIHIFRDDQSLLFSVKDTGIGIPAEKHSTIFEAFQQADGSTRREFGGTGLGLSISRELAKLMGGEIRLNSVEGKGSEFVLILPLDRNLKERGTEDRINSSREREEPTIDNEPKYLSEVIPPSLPDDRDEIKKGDKSILIIEDDTDFAKALLDYTRSKGYKGIVAVRGDEGVQLAKKFLPLGILLDVQLPVKSGWEVMDELKSNTATRPIPVHMMSSHEVRSRSLLQGAVDFINKPVAFEKLSEMFQKIEQALSNYPKKVLIVEENKKHAEALAYFLENFNVSSEIKESVDACIDSLKEKEIDCVILDMGIPAMRSYETLEKVKQTPGLENLPIIIFTGKNLSSVEEVKIKQYADSIVIKTAHSYQRILDEVSLFLHLMEENRQDVKTSKYKKMGELEEVLKGKTILLADDDVRNIFSLTKALEKFNINVLSAINGQDALNKLKENKNVDLVLMDMMMPELDGYESTRRIRKMPEFKKMPIIAVTAKAMTGDREKCIAAGASDYITKPVDIDQLISLLRVWLYK